MNNNEIMTTEIEETTENAESKRFNPGTGLVVVLAAYGMYHVTLKEIAAAKKLIRWVKTKKAKSVDNDVVEDDIFED